MICNDQAIRNPISGALRGQTTSGLVIALDSEVTVSGRRVKISGLRTYQLPWIGMQMKRCVKMEATKATAQ